MKFCGSVFLLLFTSCISTYDSNYYKQQAENQTPYYEEYRDPTTITSTIPSRVRIKK